LKHSMYPPPTSRSFYVPTNEEQMSMPTLEPNLNPVTGSGDAFVPFRQVSPEVARL